MNDLYNLSDIFTNYNLAIAAIARFHRSCPFSKWADHLHAEVLEDMQSLLELAYEQVMEK